MDDLMMDRRRMPRNTGRILLISGEVNEPVAAGVVAQMLEMQAKDPLEDIMMIIDSYGGELYSCLTIMNMMDMISCKISTVVLGKAMSAGAMLFANGSKGKRLMAKNSRLMLHQVSSGMEGTVKDINIEIDQIKELQDILIKNLADSSSITCEKMKEMMSRNVYLSPERAQEIGICDGIITQLN